MSRSLRKIHRTLGIFVMPLLLVVALTGLYLNHSNQIYPLLRGAPFDEATFEQDPAARVTDVSAAATISVGVFGNEPVNELQETRYHGRDVFRFKMHSGDVIVVKATGHYWVKTKYVRETFNPDGLKLDHKTYWGRIFKEMHTGIVPGGTLGTILSDIVAAALLFFSLSGLIMRFSGGRGRSQNARAEPDEVQNAVRGLIKPRRIRIEDTKPKRMFPGSPAE